MKQLKRVQKYLEMINDRSRRGHHNFVIEREVGNLVKPLSQMNPSELKAFDENLLKRLKAMDLDEDNQNPWVPIENKTKIVNIRISKSLDQKLTEISKRDKVSVSHVVRSILEQYFKR